MINFNDLPTGEDFCHNAGKKPVETRFKEFHDKNPQVWAEFKRIGLWAVSVCLKKDIQYLSADLIANQVRWKSFISSTDKEFKINNNWTSYFSRMFQIEYPEYAYLFRNRKTTAEKAETAIY